MKRNVQGLFYRLAYSNIVTSSKRIFLHQVRDGMAFCEIAAALAELGYRFATTFHMYNDDKNPTFDLPDLGPRDLLVLTTRPPLNDIAKSASAPKGASKGAARAENAHRRNLRPTEAALENACFDVVRPYFRHCDRAEVAVSDRVARLMRPETSEYRDVRLYQYTRDHVKAFRRGDRYVGPRGGDEWTLAFFFRLPKVPGLDCGMILSFGMSGFSTLAWNRILRIRHPEWIATRRFVMARMSFSGLPPWPGPHTPAFVDDPTRARVEVLAEEELG